MFLPKRAVHEVCKGAGRAEEAFWKQCRILLLRFTYILTLRSCGQAVMHQSNRGGLAGIHFYFENTQGRGSAQPQATKTRLSLCLG